MKAGRVGRRWTLGSLMLVIALVALPMAWYVHQARENVRLETAKLTWIRKRVARNAPAKRAKLMERFENAPLKASVAPQILEPPR